MASEDQIPLKGTLSETDRLTPDEAFAALGNKTRIEILRTLWEARGSAIDDPDAPDNTVSFSELYHRVGYDTASNFTYHLEQLTGHFVRKTGDRYALTWPGVHLVRSLIAGTVTNLQTVNPTETDAYCPICDAPVEIVYTYQLCTIKCTQCAGLLPERMGPGFLFQSALPPGGLTDRTIDEILHASVTYGLHRIASFQSGICPQCSGPVDTLIDVCETHEWPEVGVCPDCDRYHLSEVTYSCRQCNRGIHLPATVPILGYPAVIALYHNRGIEHEFASWASFQRSLRVDEELVGTDPLRLRFGLPCTDDHPQVIVDGTLAIVDIEQ